MASPECHRIFPVTCAQGTNVEAHGAYATDTAASLADARRGRERAHQSQSRHHPTRLPHLMNDSGNAISEHCAGVTFFLWVCGDVGRGGPGRGFCHAREAPSKIASLSMLGLVGRCVNVGVGYWVL